MSVLRLYPPPAQALPLQGLYLGEIPPAADRPFVYTNFVTSLDGRTSQPDPVSARRRVPPAIANRRDWRLYLELAAQADVLLTTTRHLRAVAAGRHANLLALHDHADLARWRRRRGLPIPPVVAVVSRRLDIPGRAVKARHRGPILAITTERVPANAARAVEDAGIEVIRAGPGPQLSGEQVLAPLAARGLMRVYSIAGPHVLHTLLEADRVDRLYLTTAHLLLGGEQFDTLTYGSTLDPPRGFCLRGLYLDRDAPGSLEQLYASMDRARDGERDSPLSALGKS